MAAIQDWLVLVLDAPLMSFGGVLVDQHGVTRDHPGRAMLTGLLGNALGYDHRDAAELERLQGRLRHASLALRPGQRLVDFHTVDLGQPFLHRGWTTRGRPQGREGGTAATGTHIRWRHYLADAVRVVVLRLDPVDEAPDLDRVAAALDRPARPLFLGRKACLPARPLLAGRVEAAGAMEALRRGRRMVREKLADETGALGGNEAEWSLDDGDTADIPPPDARLERLSDRRDWANQLVGGERRVAIAPLADEDSMEAAS